MQFDLGRKPVAAGESGAIVNAAPDIYKEEDVLLRPHIFYVKRIVGLPGESIHYTDSQILCNGKDLHIPRDIRECYTTFENYTGYEFGAEEYLVPDEHIYVISDNLGSGRDSRHLGALPLASWSVG